MGRCTCRHLGQPQEHFDFQSMISRVDRPGYTPHCAEATTYGTTGRNEACLGRTDPGVPLHGLPNWRR